MMLAGVSSEHGLQISHVARPEPAEGQVLVDVAAAGMNRADLNAAKGGGVATRDSLGRPVGMEWAGRIVAVGAGVTAFAIGDMVACSGTGGYAEYAVADAGRCLPLAEGLDPTEAGGLRVALMTAHNALVTEGNFQRDMTVLVHGASSAVGIAAMRIARLLGASIVMGTSSTLEKRNQLDTLGADVAIDSARDDWVDEVLSATGTRGADVVIDMVTGSGLNATMRATAIHGTIVNVGRLGGLRCDLDLDLHSARRLRLTGVTFRTRSVPEIHAINTGVARDLWPQVMSGALRLPIARAFPLAQAQDAHAFMAANHHLGKILLVP